MYFILIDVSTRNCHDRSTSMHVTKSIRNIRYDIVIKTTQRISKDYVNYVYVIISIRLITEQDSFLVRRKKRQNTPIKNKKSLSNALSVN